MNKISLIIICLFVQLLNGCTMFEALCDRQVAAWQSSSESNAKRIQRRLDNDMLRQQEYDKLTQQGEDARKHQTARMIIQASRTRVLNGVAIDVVEYDKIIAESCDKLVIRLCGDLGTDTYICNRMKDRAVVATWDPDFTDDGVLQQWVRLHHIELEDICISLENKHYPKLLEELGMQEGLEREKIIKEEQTKQEEIKLAHEQEMCSKNKRCVIDQENKSYVDKICTPILNINATRDIIAQENSNPSGVRNLRVLYEAGKEIQQYQLERREANIEFRNRYHRAFPESICKKYADEQEEELKKVNDLK